LNPGGLSSGSDGISTGKYLFCTSLTRDLRSFEIQIRICCPIQFDSKVIGRFENFLIESAVPAPLLVVSLVKRLKPLTALSVTA